MFIVLRIKVGYQHLTAPYVIKMTNPSAGDVCFIVDRLQDMYEAFPNIECVERDNIDRFRSAVEMLFTVSDNQRRRIKGHMRKFKDLVSSVEMSH